ncbi:MAG: cytochrome c [Bacteroidetes bacterium]|nr:cytochrome c [Bacteroidota bacterium]
METGIRHTHLLSVILFLLIYLIKTVLLLSNKNEGLAKFTKAVKVPEMIVSTLFLATGIYLITQIPEIKSLLIIKIVAVLISIPLAIIGFKKKNKVLAVFSLLLIIGAYGMAEMSKKQKSKSMEALSANTLNGQELFNASCISCHGADGKLGLMEASDLSISTIDFAAKIEIIKNGKGAMTPFAEILSEEQIKAVAEYTESLKK